MVSEGSGSAALRLGTALIVLALAACSSPTPPAASATAATAMPPATQSPLGSYLAAEHAQDAHDYTTAATLMERALADDPNNLDLVRRTFVLRVSEGRIAQSVPLATRLVAADGNNGLPAITLLVEDLKTGNYDSAVLRGQSMERLGPQRFAVPLLDAWAEAGRKNAASAQAALSAMGEVQGLEPLRQLHLGMVDDYLGDAAGAQQAYDKVLASTAEPTYRVVRVIGNFDERHLRDEDAKRLYQLFAASSGESQLANASLARIAAGKVPAPVIRSAQDGAADALFDLASVLDQGDTVDAALIYARLSLELNPKLALSQLLLAEIRDADGRTEDALALDRAVDPASPLAWTARLRAALALDRLGRTDEALAGLKAMAAAEPTDVAAILEEGDILRSHDRYTEAATAYAEAIARAPKTGDDQWRLYYDRGVALERSGDWTHAEADLTHALQLSPDQPLVLNYLGYSWIDKGENLTQALQMVEHAVALSPNDGYMIDSLGWAYYRLGNLPKATEYLERAIELLPEDPTINDHLGDVYWQSGRLTEARFQWRRALQFGPEQADVKSIETKLDRGLQKPPQQAVSGG